MASDGGHPAPWTRLGTAAALLSYLDSSAGLGNRPIWKALTTAFRIAEDPGALFALVRAFQHVVVVGRKIGLAGDNAFEEFCAITDHLAAIVARVPDALRLRIANPRIGISHARGSPEYFPLLACFTVDFGNPALTARITAVQAIIILAVIHGPAATSLLATVAHGIRKAQSLPHPWAELLDLLPDPDAAADWQDATRHRCRDLLARLDPKQPLAPAQIAFLKALLSLLHALHESRRISRRTFPAVADRNELDLPPGELRPLRRARPPVIQKRQTDGDAEREAPALATLIAPEPRDSDDEPAQQDLATAEPTTVQESEAPAAEVRRQDRRNAYRLTEIRQTLRWSWDHLNHHDISLPVTAARLALHDHEPSGSAALFAMLSMATGIGPADLSQLAIDDEGAPEHLDSTGHWVRPVLRPPFGWSAQGGHTTQLERVEDHLRLPLPGWIADALSRRMAVRPAARSVGALVGCGPADAIAFLSAWLDPLRTRHPNARLTHGRMAAALGVELYARTQDDLVVHTLLGRPEDVPPTGSYYGSMRLGDLRQTYADACAALFGDAPYVVPDTRSGLAGSTLVPRAEIMAGFIESMICRIEAASGRDPIESHNAFCLYVLWLLMAGTGHRPVQDPFERIELFDLNRKLVCINDKAGPGRSGRLVPLTTLSTKQLEHYLTHLRILAAALQPDAPELAAAILGATVPRRPRALPLFFLLVPEGSGWQRIGVAELRVSLGPLAGLPANLFRHVLRATAARESWPPALVHELLGHVEAGLPAFGNASSLMPADYDALRGPIETALRETGWRVIPGPLARRRIEYAPGLELRLRNLPELPLGMALRRDAAARRLGNARQAVNDVMREALGRRRLDTIDQSRVNAMVRAVLKGRRAPADLPALERYARLHRRLVYLKARYSLAIALPARYSALPLEPAAFPADSLVLADAGRALVGAFGDLAFRRARAQRLDRVPPDRAVVEAVASAVLHSWVLDARLLHNLLRSATCPVVDAGPFGLLGEFELRVNAHDIELRRHRLHPLTAALMLRLAQADREAHAAASAGKAFVQLVTQLAACARLDPPERPSWQGALDWLIERTRPLARLALPATLATFQDGMHQSVSLPREALVRILTGRPARSLVSAQPGDSATEAGTADGCATDEPRLPVTEGTAADTSTTERARARSMPLDRTLREAIRTLVRQRGETTRGGRTQYLRSHRSKDALAGVTRRALSDHDDAPEAVRLLAAWLLHLCEHGTRDQPDLRASTCATYYETLAGPLLRCCPEQRLTALHEDALADVYGRIIESVPSRNQDYTLGRLREFHRFLMDGGGVPMVDWLDIAPEECVRHIAVDAGFIGWHDHVAILELLRHDPAADPRTRHLQAAIWFFCFRFGLRSGEAFGLRRRDLIVDAEPPVVLVRHNDYRETKTEAGIRQVPLIGPLLEAERALLEDWVAHIGEYADDDSLAALFSAEGEPRRLIDRRGITARIEAAMRAVTGAPRMRLHYARHAFATRGEWLMTLDGLPRDGALREATRRIIGPIEPHEARCLLLDETTRSARGPWALSAAIGHAAPAITARHYQHATDLLAALWLGARFEETAVRCDVPTLAYLTGKHAARLRSGAAGAADLALDEPRVRNIGHGTFVPLDALAVRTPSVPALPGRNSFERSSVTLEQIDRVLEQVHRRGRTDAVGRALFLDGEELRRLLADEYDVRNAARYDIAQSGWIGTPTRHALRHLRTGKRTPSERRAVRSLLRGPLAELLHEAEGRDLATDAARIWCLRHAPGATALALGNGEDLSVMVRWLRAIGQDVAQIELRMPDAVATPESRAMIAESVGLPASCITLGKRVRSLPERVRALAAQRVGLMVTHGAAGPLFGMNQFNRALFVLAVYLWQAIGEDVLHAAAFGRSPRITTLRDRSGG